MLGAAIMFTLTALGGAAVASFPIRKIPRPPTWLALGHGAVAIASFAVLAYSFTTSTTTQLEQLAAAVLALAAVGGLTLFLGFHLRGKALPLLFVVGHGILAISGLALLWFSVARGL